MKSLVLSLLFMSLVLNGGAAVLFLILLAIDPAWVTFLLFAWNGIWFLLTLETLKKMLELDAKED